MDQRFDSIVGAEKDSDFSPPARLHQFDFLIQLEHKLNSIEIPSSHAPGRNQ
jgi:hypothetical protein